MHNDGLQDFVERMPKVSIPGSTCRGSLLPLVSDTANCKAQTLGGGHLGRTVLQGKRMSVHIVQKSAHPFAYGGPSCRVKTSCTDHTQIELAKLVLVPESEDTSCLSRLGLKSIRTPVFVFSSSS